MKTDVITCSLYDDSKDLLAKMRAQKQELVFILGRDRQFLKAADAGEVAGILRPIDAL
jgi:hypothetical protein